jgi:SOS-response transcriptional repressor LexA
MTTSKLTNFLPDNLRRLRGSTSQTEYSKYLDIPLASYQRYESGSSVKVSVLDKIAAKVGCSTEDLFREEGWKAAKVIQEDQQKKHEEITSTSLLKELKRGQMIKIAGVTWQAVPLISWTSAGEATCYTDVEWQFDELVMAPTRNQNAFALEVEGESMEPKYCAGAVAIVEPGYQVRKYSLVVVRFIEDGGVLFKQILKTGEDGGDVVLHSYNKDYKDIIRPRSDFRFIYPVLEVRNNAKFSPEFHLDTIMNNLDRS